MTDLQFHTILAVLFAMMARNETGPSWYHVLAVFLSATFWIMVAVDVVQGWFA